MNVNIGSIWENCFIITKLRNSMEYYKTLKNTAVRDIQNSAELIWREWYITLVSSRVEFEQCSQNSRKIRNVPKKSWKFTWPFCGATFSGSIAWKSYGLTIGLMEKIRNLLTISKNFEIFNFRSVLKTLLRFWCEHKMVHKLRAFA